MYNTEGRRCPVHPTVIRSCPICATPGTTAATPATVILAGIDYQAETDTPYNTPQPFSRKHDNMEGFAMEHGLDEHWDDRHERRPVVPPTQGTLEELLDNSADNPLSATDGVVLWPGP